MINEELKKKKHGGSKKGKAQNRPPIHELEHEKLMINYFNNNARYTQQEFRRRFRMPKDLFKSFVKTLEENVEYGTFLVLMHA